MWRGYGRLTAVGADRLDYRISTAHGQSGAAVGLYRQEDPIAVGIHAEPNTARDANLAVRVTDDLIRTVDEWRREFRTA